MTSLPQRIPLPPTFDREQADACHVCYVLACRTKDGVFSWRAACKMFEDEYRRLMFAPAKALMGGNPPMIMLAPDDVARRRIETDRMVLHPAAMANPAELYRSIAAEYKKTDERPPEMPLRDAPVAVDDSAQPIAVGDIVRAADGHFYRLALDAKGDPQFVRMNLTPAGAPPQAQIETVSPPTKPDPRLDSVTSPRPTPEPETYTHRTSGKPAKRRG